MLKNEYHSMNKAQGRALLKLPILLKRWMALQKVLDAHIQLEHDSSGKVDKTLYDLHSKTESARERIAWYSAQMAKTQAAGDALGVRHWKRVYIAPCKRAIEERRLAAQQILDTVSEARKTFFDAARELQDTAPGLFRFTTLSSFFAAKFKKSNEWVSRSCRKFGLSIEELPTDTYDDIEL